MEGKLSCPYKIEEGFPLNYFPGQVRKYARMNVCRDLGGMIVHPSLNLKSGLQMLFKTLKDQRWKDWWTSFTDFQKDRYHSNLLCSHESRKRPLGLIAYILGNPVRGRTCGHHTRSSWLWQLFIDCLGFRRIPAMDPTTGLPVNKISENRSNIFYRCKPCWGG